MTSPRAISAPRSLMMYSLAGKADVVANANGRDENAELLRRLLAEHRDALEQIAALLFVDERDERVADFELDRIDLQQIGHRIGRRRRRRFGLSRGRFRRDALPFGFRGGAADRDDRAAEQRGTEASASPARGRTQRARRPRCTSRAAAR